MSETVFQGTAGNDLLDASGLARPNWAVLRGLAGNDTLIGGVSNDRLSGGAGNDLLIGGDGFDGAFYSHARALATILRNADGSWTITGPEGTDTLYSVEYARFSDFTYRLASVEHDFNADLRSDILWQTVTPGATTRLLSQWQVNGGTYVTGNTFATLDAGTRVADTADFNGDGRADLLLLGADGVVSINLMNGYSVIGSGAIYVPDPGMAFTVAGTGDLNGDGRDDILFQRVTTDSDGNAWRTVSLWQMDGLAGAGGGVIAMVSAVWSVAGVADFDFDGRADILWRATDGSLTTWRMSGTNVIGGGNLFNPGADWKVGGTGDFNGDGRADVLFHHANGSAAVWLMNGSTVLGSATIGSMGPGWEVAGVADYNGDSRSDILWRQVATPGTSFTEVRVWTMNGLTVTSDQSLSVVSTDWQIV